MCTSCTPRTVPAQGGRSPTCNTGIVDEDIESVDFPDGRANLRGTGHVQCQRRDALIGVGKGLARAGIDPFRASPQSLLDQRFSEAAIGSSHQNY
jgi:hypothetical protein